MKKIILFFLAFCLLASFSACEKERYSSEEEIYEEGLSLIETMSEIIQSEEYLKIYSSSDSLAALANDIDTRDYDDPIAVYRIEVPDAEEYLETVSDFEEVWEKLSPALKKQVKNKITFSAFASIINRKRGSEKLAFSSAFIATEKDTNLILEEETVFLYVFEEGTPIAVTFSENGAVLGQFVFLENIDKFSDAKETFKQYRCSVHRVDID